MIIQPSRTRSFILHLSALFWAYRFWETPKMKCLFCSDFISLDINSKRKWNIGRWIIEFLPLYSPLIFLYLYWTIITLKKESKMCDKGLWETFHLTDVQRVTANIRNVYWNNFGLSLKSDVSKDFPARYLWSKKTFTACHLTISLERSRVVRKRSF